MGTASALGHRQPVRVGSAELRPATCEIVGPGGREKVQPKVMQVMVALVDAGGGTVTRDDIVERCWGSQVVGDDSINRVIFRIRRLAEGVAAGSFAVETITKVGYRLVEVGGGAALPAPDAAVTRRSWWPTAGERALLLSFAALAATVAVVVAW